MSDHAATLIYRARLLRDTGRDEEAISLLMEALGQDPENAEVHTQLALARMEVKGQRGLAVESIDEALRIQADNPYILALKGHILVRLDRDKEGIKYAEQAIALEPDLDFAWVVKATGYMGLNEWEKAEEAAREALVIDADNSDAANFLAIILRAQGKLEDSNLQVDSLLHQNAEDPFALSTNGWTALQRGDQKQAEEFFCDALRIDPENQYAKDGLKEAYKSRSWFYRIFLKWVFFMQKYTEGKQILIAIGLYVAFRVLRGVVGGSGTGLGMVLLGVWIGFICWATLAPAIGNFILLKDSRARLALENWEKRSGLLVGLPFLIGLVIGITGLGLSLTSSSLIPHPGNFAFSGLILIFACFPGARVFGNGSIPGKCIFGAFALFAFVAALYCMIQPLVSTQEDIPALAMNGFIGAALSTWLTFIPGIYKPLDPMDG